MCSRQERLRDHEWVLAMLSAGRRSRRPGDHAAVWRTVLANRTLFAGCFFGESLVIGRGEKFLNL